MSWRAGLEVPGVLRDAEEARKKGYCLTPDLEADFGGEEGKEVKCCKFRSSGHFGFGFDLVLELV